MEAVTDGFNLKLARRAVIVVARLLLVAQDETFLESGPSTTALVLFIGDTPRLTARIRRDALDGSVAAVVSVRVIHGADFNRLRLIARVRPIPVTMTGTPKPIHTVVPVSIAPSTPRRLRAVLRALIPALDEIRPRRQIRPALSQETHRRRRRRSPGERTGETSETHERESGGADAVRDARAVRGAGRAIGVGVPASKRRRLVGARRRGASRDVVHHDASGVRERTVVDGGGDARADVCDGVWRARGRSIDGFDGLVLKHPEMMKISRRDRASPRSREERRSGSRGRRWKGSGDGEG